MANIDIKKLFVKVPSSAKETFDAHLAKYNAGETSLIDSSKIYFVSDGRIVMGGKEYGFDDAELKDIKDTLEDLQGQLGETKKDEAGKYVTVQSQLDTINGDDTTEGSIKKAVKDAVDSIMGADNISDMLDTFKELQDLIAKEGFEDFITEFGSLKEHVEAFDKHVTDAKTATDKLLSDLIGNTPTTTGEGESAVTTYDPTLGELPVNVTIELDEDNNPVKTVNTKATSLKDYAEKMAEYNDQQNDRLTTNETAIVKNREDIDEHVAHNHVFFNETPQSESRNILWLNNNDAIFGKGGVSPLDADTTAKDMTGKVGMLIELSKYNVVDIADTKFHTNIQTVDTEDTIGGVTVSSNNDNIHAVKTGTSVPAVKVQDIYTVATRNELSAIYDALTGDASDLEDRVAENEAELVGIGKHVAEGETAEYSTVLNAIDGQIAKLDLEATADNAIAKDEKEYVKTTISETNGVVKNEGVEVTYGTFNTGLDLAAAPTVKGIATVEATSTFVKNAIENLDANVRSADNGTTHVIVTVGQDNGKVSSVAVETKDIASNHEFLEHKADCKKDHFELTSKIGTAPEQVAGETYETVKIQKYKVTDTNTIVEDGEAESTTKLSVWGGLAKLSADKTTEITNAIEALDSDATSTDGTNIVVKVSQEDGKLSEVNVTETYAAYTANTSGVGTLSDGIVNASTLKSVLDDLWEEFSAN